MGGPPGAANVAKTAVAAKRAMRNFAGARLALALLVLAAAGGPAFADDATETARGHYETGLELSTRASTRRR